MYSSTVAGTSQTFCPNGLINNSAQALRCRVRAGLRPWHARGWHRRRQRRDAGAFSGVAKGAQIMAIQVFSKIISALNCGGGGHVSARTLRHRGGSSA